ncbi:ABC transporter substrate-binding protein [Thermogemmatispora sp.]|uniref:ABC transporter substrate-binding protein n=1 Tax=Thermogemmatispora sp. TaxID=1968838 RepID=UPI0035E4624E
MTDETRTLLEPLLSPERTLTRRQLLRAAAAGSVALAGGAMLAACGGSSSNAVVNVTFLTNGWPGDAMPTAEQQKGNITLKAYADALADWLKKNPGVKIKHTDTNIWSQSAVTQAIAAGTAPTWFEGNILGSFINNVVRSAFARGLAADVTDLVVSTRLESQLTDIYLPVYRSWKVNGRYYGTPGGYGAGDGMYFRRDLIQQAGLVEPTPGWTWSDFRKLARALTTAKMKGAALQFYVFDQSLQANGLNSGPTGYGALGLEPTPSNAWPWRYNLTPWLSQYEQVIENWRGMYFTDKSITSSLSTGDSDVAQAFARGDVAMMANNTGFFTRPVTDPTSAVNIAARVGKPFEEVVGWISHPIGYLGSFGATQAGSAIGSIDPHLQRNKPALAKAFDFLVQFIIGDELVKQRQEIYKVTHDLKDVFLEIPPMSKLQINYGINGTAEQAWGKLTMQAVNAAAAIPQLPDPGLYFPAEQNPGPTGDAWNDANSGLAYTQDSIPAVLLKLQNVQNAQFASLSSSVPRETFIASARKFFADLDAFWAKYAPLYSAELFHPWYVQKVLPALGG